MRDRHVAVCAAAASDRWRARRLRAGAAAPGGCPKSRREPRFARSRAADLRARAPTSHAPKRAATPSAGRTRGSTSARRQRESRPVRSRRGDDEMHSVTAAASSEGARAEVERQLAASAERHREAVASMQELGRPEAGQHVAIKVIGRAVDFVSFALRRGVAAGVSFERLVELTGWEPDLVRDGLERAVPEPRVVARLAPAGVDARAVAQATAAFEAVRCLRELTQRVLAAVDPVDGDTRSPLAPADLADLHDRIETVWRSWRQELGREI